MHTRMVVNGVHLGKCSLCPWQCELRCAMLLLLLLLWDCVAFAEGGVQLFVNFPWPSSARLAARKGPPRADRHSHPSRYIYILPSTLYSQSAHSA